MATIQSLVNAAAAGSTVIIPAATYAEGVVVNKPLTIRVGGPVFVKAPGSRTSGGLRAFDIQSSKVTIDGMVDGVPMLDITAPGNDGIEGNGVHTITIRGVIAHDCGESGIQFNGSDRLTIENNVCDRNAYMSWYSGISLYECVVFPAAGPVVATEYRNVVRNNVCRNNVTVNGNHADGDGIIIDDFMLAQDSPWSASRVSYAGRTLVENNLCVGNGSKGIQCYLSEHVTIRRNTVVGNNVDKLNDGTYRGDLNVQACSDVRCEGNVCVAVRGSGILANNTAIGAMSRGVTWADNLTWNGTPGAASINVQEGGTSPSAASNKLGADPQLDANFIPQNPAASAIGWRPVGATPEPIPVPDPDPEPDPLPEPPVGLSPFAAMTPKLVAAENQAYELGTTIRVDKPGRITALRLYRTNANAQPVTLWKAGAKIASGGIPGGAEGWVEAAVDVPAAVGDEFIVSAGKTASQRYAADAGALAAKVSGDGFTIPASGGLFSITRGALPTQVWQSSYYWVDIRFAAESVPDPDPTPEPEPMPDLAALTARVASVEAQAAAMAAEYGPRILVLEEKAATLDAGYADLNARLSEMTASVSVAAITQMAEAITALATETEAIKGEAARLDGRLDAISGAARD